MKGREVGHFGLRFTLGSVLQFFNRLTHKLSKILFLIPNNTKIITRKKGCPEVRSKKDCSPFPDICADVETKVAGLSSQQSPLLAYALMESGRIRKAI